MKFDHNFLASQRLVFAILDTLSDKLFTQGGLSLGDVVDVPGLQPETPVIDALKLAREETSAMSVILNQ